MRLWTRGAIRSRILKEVSPLVASRDLQFGKSTVAFRPTMLFSDRSNLKTRIGDKAPTQTVLGFHGPLLGEIKNQRSTPYCPLLGA